MDNKCARESYYRHYEEIVALDVRKIWNYKEVVVDLN